MGTATGNSPPWQCRETASIRFSPLQLFNSYVIPKSAVAYSDSNGREEAGAHPKHTHTHPFNGPFSGTTQVSRYQKGKTNLDFTEARDSE